jgi:hypothetical protein
MRVDTPENTKKSYRNASEKCEIQNISYKKACIQKNIVKT